MACSVLLTGLCAATSQADVEFIIDDADGWRAAIGEPLTAIDWYPHWLPPGDLPQSDLIPVEFYIDLGIRTGFVDPTVPDVVEPRPAFDMAYTDPNTPPFFMAGSAPVPDPDGAHLWFSSPVNGFQLTLLQSASYNYGFFPAKFFLNGQLVGETMAIPQNAYGSLGIVTDFQFDQVQAKSALGQLEFPTIATDPDCPDINGDGEVGVDEVLAVIAAWNSNDPDADVNDDGTVNTNDLLLVLSDWGLCT